MITTVEIPEDVLDRAMEFSQARSAQELIVAALQEYARRHDQSQVLQFLGRSETFATAEEVERLRRTK